MPKPQTAELGAPMAVVSVKSAITFEERRTLTVERMSGLLKAFDEAVAGLPEVPCPALGILRNNVATMKNIIATNIAVVPTMTED